MACFVPSKLTSCHQMWWKVLSHFLSASLHEMCGRGEGGILPQAAEFPGPALARVVIIFYNSSSADGASSRCGAQRHFDLREKRSQVFWWDAGGGDEGWKGGIYRIKLNTDFPQPESPSGQQINFSSHQNSPILADLFLLLDCCQHREHGLDLNFRGKICREWKSHWQSMIGGKGEGSRAAKGLSLIQCWASCPAAGHQGCKSSMAKYLLRILIWRSKEDTRINSAGESAKATSEGKDFGIKKRK